jgi:taspase (threonine aspartase 1)
MTMEFSDEEPHQTGGDGAVDRIWKRGARPPVAAVFIHAGAGYHSTTNEKVHLEACSEYVNSTL